MAPLWGANRYDARQAGATLARSVHQAQSQPDYDEVLINGAVVNALRLGFSALGLRSWAVAPTHSVPETVATSEHAIGADFGLLLLDPNGNVQKLALVQAKIASKLNNSEFCRLAGQCQTLQGQSLGTHGTWVWVYQLLGGYARAFPASEVLSVHSRLGVPNRSTGQPLYKADPLPALRARKRSGNTDGWALEDWFLRLLRCPFAKRAPFSAPVILRWIRQSQVRLLVVVAPAGGATQFHNAMHELEYSVFAEGRPWRELRGPE